MQTGTIGDQITFAYSKVSADGSTTTPFQFAGNTSCNIAVTDPKGNTVSYAAAPINGVADPNPYGASGNQIVLTTISTMFQIAGNYKLEIITTFGPAATPTRVDKSPVQVLAVKQSLI